MYSFYDIVISAFHFYAVIIAGKPSFSYLQSCNTCRVDSSGFLTLIVLLRTVIGTIWKVYSNRGSFPKNGIRPDGQPQFQAELAAEI